MRVMHIYLHTFANGTTLPVLVTLAHLHAIRIPVCYCVVSLGSQCIDDDSTIICQPERASIITLYRKTWPSLDVAEPCPIFLLHPLPEPGGESANEINGLYHVLICYLTSLGNSTSAQTRTQYVKLLYWHPNGRFDGCQMQYLVVVLFLHTY
jgi:hypothetical protein